MDLENQSGSEIDVDKLLSEVYGSEEIPNGNTQAPPPAPPPTQVKEWELDIRGQKIKADEQNLLKWAQQGYDYSQNINSFKTEKDSWLKEKTDCEQRISPYRQIDEFAKQNPDWWETINQGFQKRDEPQIPDEKKSYLQPIVKNYSEVKTIINDVQREKEEARIKNEDNELDKEIKSLRSHYSDLDFDVKDQSGQSLEQRILDHGTKNGFRSFSSAFKDYYHEELIKRAESRGREAVSADVKKRQKLGLLNDSAPDSFTAKRPASGIKWSDRSLSGAEILKELNLGG